MASLTQWTWAWVDSVGWWWTGKPGVLRFMGLQRMDMTEQLNWRCEPYRKLWTLNYIWWFSRVRHLAIWWTISVQAPWGFFTWEYWSGLPWSPPGDLPNPGIEPRSSTLQVYSLPSEPPGKPINYMILHKLNTEENSSYWRKNKAKQNEKHVNVQYI